MFFFFTRLVEGEREDILEIERRLVGRFQRNLWLDLDFSGSWCRAN